jgi:hypothetical protein
VDQNIGRGELWMDLRGVYFNLTIFSSLFLPRPTGNSSTFVIDPETSECLHYEPVMGYPPTTIANIPREILAEHPEVEIRNDLIDCSIDVCSVEVRGSSLFGSFFCRFAD